ncbi:probable G-protein coupled receptor 160 isoform X2 [Tupaia chinensis]|uniref:probable G-protein coupled receptor 160 isoform X2 n=1 Tax=Tupaia chinensis TaxID=246437 RepID=UPI000FFBB05C|nr:probable G-protein coupled receptor 160 isoform X2 [Tupaia chinensis]
MSPACQKRGREKRAVLAFPFAASQACLGRPWPSGSVLLDKCHEGDQCRGSCGTEGTRASVCSFESALTAEPTHVAFRGSKVRCRKPEVITEGKKAAKPSCVGRAAGKPADSRGKKQVKNV